MPLEAERLPCRGSDPAGARKPRDRPDPRNAGFLRRAGGTPGIELIEPDYIEEAYQGVLASDVRYRFVIDTGSLR